MASSAEKLSSRQVLDNCDSSFKQLFDMTLLPRLVEHKIVPKGLEKKIDVLGPARAPDVLLAVLMKTKEEKFVELLRILETHAKEDMRTRRLMGVMNSHIRNMAIPGGEGSEAEAIIHSFLDMAERYNIKQSRTAETGGGKEGTTAEADVEQGGDVSLPLSPPPSLPPQRPSGHRGGCVSGYFGQEGGVLYSPIHGIRIEVPPNSLPQRIAQCFLSIFVYSSGPFTLPDGVESCSPVVWIKLHPQFTFEKDVTLTIPHSACLSTDSELSVYRTAADKRSPPYHLSEKVSNSKCDWYHVVVRVRHFSPHQVGAEETSRKEKGTGGDKCLRKAQHPSLKHTSKRGVGTQLKQLGQKSSSFELSSSASEELTLAGSSGQSQHQQHSNPISSHSATSSVPSANVGEEPTLYVPLVSTQSGYSLCRSVNLYCITRCMPKDRSCIPWEAKFYVAQDHPTALWELHQAMKKGNGCDFSSLKKFRFIEEKLQFTCQEVSEGWEVYPTEGNEITIADLQSWCWSEAVNLTAYPTFLTYCVSAVGGALPLPLPPLKCVIDIRGANRSLTYTLTSTQPNFKDHTSTSLLTTPCHLYDKAGTVVQHLSSGDIGNLYLDTEQDEHLRLITDISLQLRCPTRLAQMLNMQYEYEDLQRAEDSFCLLWSWVCKKSEQKNKTLTLRDLCAALKINGVMLSMPEANEDCPYLHPEYEGECVQLEDHLLLKIVNTLQACWKFVGRFLGIREHYLTAIAESSMGPQQSGELAHEMIRRWHSLKGREADYRTLFRAIHRLWEFDSMRANCHDTFCLVRKHCNLQSHH